MTAPLITLAAIAALAIAYVVGPIIVDAFLRFHRARTVSCPETGGAAQVKIDARRAAFSAVPGPPEIRVAECSLWPGRKGCAQKCVVAMAR